MLRIYIILLCLIGNLSLSAQSNNPFDIVRSADDSLKELEAPLATNVEPSTKLEGENPFSVSHVPIRKNQFKKIESLRTVRQTTQENISIGYLPLWIVTASLCVLAYLLFLSRNHIQNLFRSILNDNYLRLMQYEENSGLSISYLLGYLLFLINTSLFAYLILTKVFSYQTSYLLPKVLGAFTVFFIGKHFVMALFAWIYEYEKESVLYSFAIITIRNILSLIFIFLNIILVFGSDGWYKAIGVIGVGFFIIGLLSRYYKGIGIARSYINQNIFHFFLYFCAFEMAPWLILYKFIGA